MKKRQYSTASRMMTAMAPGAMRRSHAILFILVAFHLYCFVWSLSWLVMRLVAVRGWGGLQAVCREAGGSQALTLQPLASIQHLLQIALHDAVDVCQLLSKSGVRSLVGVAVLSAARGGCVWLKGIRGHGRHLLDALYGLIESNEVIGPRNCVYHGSPSGYKCCVSRQGAVDTEATHSGPCCCCNSPTKAFLTAWRNVNVCFRAWACFARHKKQMPSSMT